MKHILIIKQGVFECAFEERDEDGLLLSGWHGPIQQFPSFLDNRRFVKKNTILYVYSDMPLNGMLDEISNYFKQVIHINTDIEIQ